MSYVVANGDYVPLLNVLLAKNSPGSESLYFVSKVGMRGYEVDGLAAEICRKIDGKISLQKIADEIVKEYEVEGLGFLAEFNGLVENLKSESLIDWVIL